LKKVCSVFLIVTFWVAFADVFIFLFSGILSLIYAPAIIDYLIPYFNDPSYTADQIATIVTTLVYTVSISILFTSTILVGPLVVCPITNRKLKTAKSRREMIALGVLNVIFGSTVSGILIFCMPDRYYKDAKPINPHEELGDLE